MGFISGQHLFLFLIFLAIVLIVFGPGKLPEVGSGVGKAIREFRKATTEVKDHVTAHTAEPEPQVTPAAPPITPGATVEPPQPVAGGTTTSTRVGG